MAAQVVDSQTSVLKIMGSIRTYSITFCFFLTLLERHLLMFLRDAKLGWDCLVFNVFLERV